MGAKSPSMEILEVYLMGGTMACIAVDGGRPCPRPPRIVRAAGVVFRWCGGVSCDAGVSRCAGSARAPPILTLIHRELEDFKISASPGRFEGVLISRRSLGAADSFLSLLN